MNTAHQGDYNDDGQLDNTKRLECFLRLPGNQTSWYLIKNVPKGALTCLKTSGFFVNFLCFLQDQRD